MIITPNNATYSRKQLEFLFNSDKPYTFTEGAVRSGKTWITCIDFLSKLGNPAFEGYDKAIIGKTESTIRRNVISTLRRMLPKDAIHNSKNEIHIYGNRIYLIGANNITAMSKVQGLTAALIYGDELTTWPKCVFDMALTRLSVPGAKFIGTMNPDSPQHWFYKQWKEVINGLITDDAVNFHFSLDDNLSLDKSFKDRLRRQFAGVFYQRFIEGLWVIAEGLVLSEYNPDIHKVTKKLIEEKIKKGHFLRYWGATDWGTANPMSLGIYGITRKDEIYKLFGYYERGKITKDAIDWFIKKQLYLNRTLAYIFCDHEPDRIKEMRFKGLNAYNAVKNVEPGTSTLKTLLKNNKLYISEECTDTDTEFLSLRFPNENDPEYKVNRLDKTFIGDDHAFDETRYSCHSYKERYGFKY